MNHRLVGGRVDDIVLERGRRLVRLVVHAEIVNLHPEIQLFWLRLKTTGLPSAGATRGRTFVLPITNCRCRSSLVGTGSIWSATISDEDASCRRRIVRAPVTLLLHDP